MDTQSNKKTGRRIKKFATYSALVGGMSLAALGFGAGFAHAEAEILQPGNVGHVAQPELVSTPTAASTHETATPQLGAPHGDQEVIPRGEVIPAHGDESTPPNPDISHRNANGAN
jgi:hypothetical protein